MYRNERICTGVVSGKTNATKRNDAKSHAGVKVDRKEDDIPKQ